MYIYVKETYIYVKETYIYVKETYIYVCDRLVGDVHLCKRDLFTSVRHTKRDGRKCKRDVYT